MINNDVLRSVRFLLNVGDHTIADIIELGGLEVPLGEVAAFLEKDDASGYRECPDLVMAHFLDGLIFHRRGRDETVPPRPIETPITNNAVLKKLRVAFELKESDILEMMTAAGHPVSKPELSALFRSPGHKNYRPCGDQFLRKFLKALTQRIRG
ncbi:MAG: DUF1456 family protein [Myxococcota bacterium]|nr:DUF1456 family protein [Myxococcota bacterium]